MTTTIQPAASEGITSREPVVTERQTPAVKIWACLGVVSLLCFAYLWTAWITSGKAKTVHVGTNPLPHWMHVEFLVWEIGGLFVFAGFVWFFLVRPWRREGHITTDGLLVIAFLTLYWQDPLGDASGAWFTYNAGMINFGSWLGNVPGHLLPNANRMPEPLVWVWPIYVYCCLGMVLLATWLLRRFKARHPQMGTLGTVVTLFVGFWIFDAVLETCFNWMGIYVYTGSIHGVTIFSGSYFQFPLYEAILFGTTWASWTCLHYFRNDKGESFAERGLEKLRVTGWKRTGVRLLGLIGALNLLFMITYNLPAQYFGVHQGAWPKSIVSKSYLTDGLCGPGTSYACPGPLIPIAHPGSAHVDPSGNLVVPSGKTLAGS
jgi:hypothetical protein